MSSNGDILKERAASYGDVKRGGNIARIARLWSAWLGVEITEHDVGWMMVLLKASRSRNDVTHEDNYVDAHGYVEIARVFADE